MNSARSLHDKPSPRYFMSTKLVKPTNKDQISSLNFQGDSTTNISKSKIQFNDRTVSTEINHSVLSSSRIRKELKLPPIRVKNLLNDRSNSIDTQFSYSSVRNKPTVSIIDQIKTDRPLSRIISGAVTPIRGTLDEPLSPGKLDESMNSGSKRALNSRMLNDQGGLSRFSKYSKSLDSLAPLKTVLFDYEKSIRHQIQLLPKGVRSKTSLRNLSLAHARAVLMLLHSTINTMGITITTISTQIAKNEPYDKEAIINYQTSMLGDETLVKKLFDSIQQIIPLTRKALECRHSLPELEEVLKEIVERAKESGNYELQLYCAKIVAKYFMACAELPKALVYFKLFKGTAGMNRSLVNQARGCKYLGLCAQLRQDYQKALSYFIKMLQHSMLCHSESLEMKAYDLIGMQYYYLGDLQKAAYFHSKMSKGTFEAEDSNLRRLIEARVKQHDHPMKYQFTKNTAEVVSSDEEADIPLGRDYEEFVKSHVLPKSFKVNRLYTKQQLNSQLELTFSQKERSGQRKIVAPQVVAEYNLSQGMMDERNMSHLSPNRKIENFVVTKGQGLNSLQTQELQEVRVSKRSFAKILKFVVKFQVNLHHLKMALSEIILSNMDE